MIKERENVPRFWWEQFKELIRDRFYPILQKSKKKEFLDLEQGKMSVVWYASKFMKLSHFTLTYVAHGTLKMNGFKDG